MSIPNLRLHRETPLWLRERVLVILVEPSHPGNVGACARAMRAMGLRRLVLVSPRQIDVCRNPEAVARSSRATDVLTDARVVGSLDEALAQVTLAIAISADTREFGPPLIDPDEAAADALHELAAHPTHQVALVFGPERTGLSIAAVGRCQRVCSIPGDPDYNSLNLAQAVQVMTYVLRRAADQARVVGEHSGAERAADAGPALERMGANGLDGGSDAGSDGGTGHGRQAGGPMASAAEVEGFHAHLERALITLGFLDPAHPKKLMPRLRRLFARTRLEADEVHLLRGICKLIEQPLRPDTRRSAAGSPTASDESGSLPRS